MEKGTEWTDKKYFKNGRRQNIFYQSWRVKRREELRGAVFIFHGLGEHSSRYDYVALVLNENGLDVHALDHHGHGNSDGDRCTFFDWNDVLDDAQQFVDLILEEFKYSNDMDKFIMGHSMGGLIAISYTQERIYNNGTPKQKWSGTIISSPAYKADVNPALRFAAKAVCYITPHMGALKLDVNNISRDEAVVKNYVEDPLVYHGSVPLTTCVAIVEKGLHMQSIAKEIKWPFLVFHGTKDKLTNPEGSKEFYQNTGTASEDKELKIYEGLCHETMNEPEKDQVLGDVIAWVNKRISGQKKWA